MSWFASVTKWRDFFINICPFCTFNMHKRSLRYSFSLSVPVPPTNRTTCSAGKRVRASASECARVRARITGKVAQVFL